MMLAAAKALGEHSPALRDPSASLLPNVGTIRAVALEVAYGLARKAQEEGLAAERKPEALRQTLVESQWNPEYL
jgi:malate dehydrogenase (oxaloacetate-decarboxylating)